VPPAVKLAALPALTSTTSLDCYFGGKSGVNAPGYSGNRHERKESERFKSFSYDELTKRDP
jgi:hypothetical protein